MTKSLQQAYAHYTLGQMIIDELQQVFDIKPNTLCHRLNVFEIQPHVLEHLNVRLDYFLPADSSSLLPGSCK